MADNTVRIVITADGNQAIAGIQQVARQFNSITDATVRTQRSVSALSNTIEMAGRMAATYLSYTVIAAGFQRGIKAIEDYRQSLISLTAVIATLSRQGADQGDFAGAYSSAKAYVQQLIPYLETLDRYIVGSGKDLRTMAVEFAKYGVLLDTTNQKQRDGFIATANAIMTLTAGMANAEAQLGQEIRSVMTGQIDAHSSLGRLLQAIDPQIKQHIKTWQQEGTVLEHIGAMLQGFNQAGQDLSNTLGAVGESLNTVAEQVLRGMFLPIYRETVQVGQRLIDMFRDSQGHMTAFAATIQGEGIRAWYSFREQALLVWETVSPILTGISRLALTATDGWGQLAALLRPLVSWLNDWLSTIAVKIGTVIHKFAALGQAIVGNFSEASKMYTEAEKIWDQADIKQETLYDRNVWDEMWRGVDEHNTKIKQSQQELVNSVNDINAQVKPPQMAANLGRDIEAAKKVAEEYGKALEWQTDQLDHYRAMAVKASNDTLQDRLHALDVQFMQEASKYEREARRRKLSEQQINDGLYAIWEAYWAKRSDTEQEWLDKERKAEAQKIAAIADLYDRYNHEILAGQEETLDNKLALADQWRDKELRNLIEIAEKHNMTIDEYFGLEAKLYEAVEAKKAHIRQEYDAAALKSQQEALERQIKQWDHAYERMSDTLADWLSQGKMNLDSFVDSFKRMVAQLIAQWLIFQARLQLPVSIGGLAGTGAMFNPIAAFGGGGGFVNYNGVGMANGGGIGLATNGVFQNFLPNLLKGADIAWSMGAEGATDVLGNAATWLENNPLMSGSMFAGIGTLVMKGLFQGDWVGGIIGGASSALGYAAGGAMLGSVLGSWAGPVGAVVGGLIGNAVMGFFKDNKPDESWFRLVSGDRLDYALSDAAAHPSGHDRRGMQAYTSTSLLGRVGITSKNQNYWNDIGFDSAQAQYDFAKHVVDLVVQVDNTIAQNMSDATRAVFAKGIPEEVLSGKWMTDTDTPETAMIELFVNRYKPAFEAIDSSLGHLFEGVDSQDELEKAVQTAAEIVNMAENIPDFWRRFHEQLEKGVAEAQAAQTIQEQYNKAAGFLKPIISNALTEAVKTMDFNTFKTVMAVQLYTAIQQGILEAFANNLINNLIAKLFDNVLGLDDLMAQVVKGDISQEDFEAKLNELGSAMGEIIDTAEPMFQMIIDWTKKYLKPAEDVAKATENAANTTEDFANKIKQLRETLSQAISSLGDAMGGLVGSDFQARWIEYKGQSILNKYGINNLIGDPQQLLQIGANLYNAYNEALTNENVTADQLEFLNGAINDLNTYIGLYGQWLDIYKAKAQAIQQAFDDAKQAYISALKDEINAKQEEINRIKQTADEMQQLYNTIHDFRVSLTGTVSTPAQNVDVLKGVWSETYLKALGGDKDALRQSANDAKAYIDAVKSNSTYQDYLMRYIQLQQQLSQLEDVTNPTNDTNQQILAALQEQLAILQQQLSELETHTSLADAKAAFDAAKLQLEQATWIKQLNAVLAQIAAINSGFDTTKGAINTTGANTVNAVNTNTSATNIGTDNTVEYLNGLISSNSNVNSSVLMAAAVIRHMTALLDIQTKILTADMSAITTACYVIANNIREMGWGLYTQFGNATGVWNDSDHIARMTNPFDVSSAATTAMKQIAAQYGFGQRYLTQQELSAIFAGFADKISQGSMTASDWTVFQDYMKYMSYGAYNFGANFGYAEGGISTGSEQGHWELLHGKEAIIPLGKGSLELQTPGLNAAIKELRGEVAKLKDEQRIIGAELIKHNSRMERVISGWDVNGMPGVRP